MSLKYCIFDEYILNIITYITDISNARRFEPSYRATKKGVLAIYTYINHMFRHVNFGYFFKAHGYKKKSVHDKVIATAIS